MKWNSRAFLGTLRKFHDKKKHSPWVKVVKPQESWAKDFLELWVWVPNQHLSKSYLLEKKKHEFDH